MGKVKKLQIQEAKQPSNRIYLKKKLHQNASQLNFQKLKTKEKRKPLKKPERKMH